MANYKKSNSNRKNARSARSVSNVRSGSKKFLLARVIFFIIIATALLVSNIWSAEINARFGLSSEKRSFNGVASSEITRQEEEGGQLNVHFVDVGQGDAAIIELPDNRNIIIDGGSNEKKNKQKLLDYIPNIEGEDGKTITYFDIAILTHSDADHCGGLDEVLDKYPAKTFYRPSEKSTHAGYTDPYKAAEGGQPSLAYAQVLREAYEVNSDIGEKKVIVTDATDASQNIIKPDLPVTDEGYYEIKFYAPTRSFYSDRNDYSPIMILEYQVKKITLSGDAEREAEEIFVKEARANHAATFNDSYSVNVIKLGHHGSRTSSSEDYLETLTTPSSVSSVLLVISVGSGNSYKHPHSEVLARIKKLGFVEKNILRTDEQGNLIFSIRKVTAEDLAPTTPAVAASSSQGSGQVAIKANDGDTGESIVGTYQIFNGSNVVEFTEEKNIYSWTEISLTIIGVLFVVLFVLPVMSKGKRKRRYR